jgi:hypothetical protein
LLPRAQRLYSGLPLPRASNVGTLLAGCESPLAPSIPDGSTAELVTLRAIESEVTRYRQTGERYLACVSRLLDAGTLSELETMDATDLHNAVVIEMTAVVMRFNEAARAFRTAQGRP